MPVGAIANAVAPDVLELIRKTIFGSNVPTTSFDFNNLFGPLGNPLSGSPSPGSLASLTADIQSPGGGPANNASAESTATSSAVGNAIGAIGANAVSAMMGVPGLSTAIGQVAPISLVDAAKTLSAAMFGINEAPSEEGIAAASQDSNPDANGSVSDGDGSPGSGGDSGVGDASSSPGDGGGAGGVGGGGDSGDSGGDSGYITGGFVPGPPTGQDHVPVNLDGGEVIIPSNIVQMLGRNFFEDILVNTKSPIQVAAEKEAAKAAKGTK